MVPTWGGFIGTPQGNRFCQEAMGTGNRRGRAAVVLGMSTPEQMAADNRTRTSNQLHDLEGRIDDLQDRIDMLEERIKDDLYRLERRLDSAIDDFGSPW